MRLAMPSYDNNSSLTQYFQDISRIPLLSRDDEQELGRRIRLGIDRDEAITTLVNSNLRFAVVVAKEYRGQSLDFSDVIQEANASLLRHAQEFDDRGYRFMSFAAKGMRRAIERAIVDNGNRVIRGNIHQRNANQQFMTPNTQYQNAHGGLDAHSQWLAEHTGLPVYRAENFLLTYKGMLSLDELITSDDKAVIERLPSQQSLGDELAEQLELSVSVRRITELLSPRERSILFSYFGLAGYQEQTLEEIGRDIGLSRERVRQIKEKALKTLRPAALEEGLKDYW